MPDARLIEIGAGRQAHASGALWLPLISTLLLADVHLGYTWAMKRRNRLGPVTEGGVREKLNRVIEELTPETVLFLGDVVHAPRPSPEERRIVENTLCALVDRHRVIVVRGNHDRAFARDYRDLNVQTVETWETQDVVAVHGDRKLPSAVDDRHLLLGHIHPAVRVIDHAGASRRIPAFLTSRELTRSSGLFSVRRRIRYTRRSSGLPEKNRYGGYCGYRKTGCSSRTAPKAPGSLGRIQRIHEGAQECRGSSFVGPVRISDKKVPPLVQCLPVLLPPFLNKLKGAGLHIHTEQSDPDCPASAVGSSNCLFHA